MAILRKTSLNVKETNREVLGQTMTLLNQALALVAALAWNEAVKAILERYFPGGSGLYSKFAYAIILTFIVVIIGRYIARIKQRFGPEESETSDSPAS